jgi:hypothetical protein
MRCPLTDHRDLTEGSPPGGLTEYERVQATPQFAELRDRFRKFVFPWTIFFLLWYFLYVLLAAFAPGFMSTKVFGNINLGFIFGGLQFVSERHGDRRRLPARRRATRWRGPAAT